MPFPPDAYPDLPALTAGLSAAFGGPVAVVGREPNAQTSTFPSEVVTCRPADGAERRVLCKYGVGNPSHTAGGHRGGVGYEAAVYRDVVRTAGVSAPHYYGQYTDPATGAVWLFVEYLAGGTRLSKSPPGAMVRTAGWLGQFHRAFEGRAVPGLNAYDADYYRAWARRAAEFAAPLRSRYLWIDALAGRFAAEIAADLGRVPATVIHGEFYPANVLVRDGVVYPVDWESAAVAPGEIDLASLTEWWPAAVAAECEQEYRQARWPAGGVPGDFTRRLAAARLYWGFRWLGNAARWTVREKAAGRFAQVRAVGAELGLI